MESELEKIEGYAAIRKSEVDSAIKEYRELRSSSIYTIIEEKLIGEKLKLEDIKYF